MNVPGAITRFADGGQRIRGWLDRLEVVETVGIRSDETPPLEMWIQRCRVLVFRMVVAPVVICLPDINSDGMALIVRWALDDAFE